MSAGKQIERAVRRADRRDKKRRPGMKVSGKGVFALAKVMRKSR